MFVESEYIPAETERTAHKDIPPASLRIRNFKCKEMPLLEGAVKEIRKRDSINYMKKLEAKEKGLQTGLYFSNMGSVYDVPSQAGDVETKPLADSVMAQKIKTFEKTERATMKHPFTSFYSATAADGKPQEVKYDRMNRFEGRGSHFHYYPTNDLKERRLENFWWETQNRGLQKKREFEEVKQTMNQWGQARGRIEAEIQRKKEHLNTATNFEKARGFVRTDFKSKKFDPNRNPCEESSSTDESEIERRQAAENVDRISDDFALNKSLGGAGRKRDIS